MSDRFVLTFGVCAVVFATTLQYSRHALWFQQPDNPHAASTTTREAMFPSIGAPDSRPLHRRSSIRAARPLF